MKNMAKSEHGVHVGELWGLEKLVHVSEIFRR